MYLFMYNLTVFLLFSGVQSAAKRFPADWHRLRYCCTPQRNVARHLGAACAELKGQLDETLVTSVAFNRTICCRNPAK